MPPTDDSRGQGSDDERQRQAAAMNDLLGAIGVTPSRRKLAELAGGPLNRIA
jgi:hypothetical protein